MNSVSTNLMYFYPFPFFFGGGGWFSKAHEHYACFMSEVKLFQSKFLTPIINLHHYTEVILQSLGGLDNFEKEMETKQYYLTSFHFLIHVPAGLINIF